MSIQQIYSGYVKYCTSIGVKPMPYLEWVAMVR